MNHLDLRQLTEGFSGQAFDDVERCPICGGSSVIIEHVKIINPAVHQTLELRECRNCAHWWINPKPRQEFLSHLYTSASASVIETSWAGTSQETSSEAERKTLSAETGRKPGRLLEIGVGKGVLYRGFAGRQWECHGVEPGDWGAPLPNVRRSIAEIDPELRFDVIVALDVLEHLSDPQSMLRQLRRLATADCRLYCAFPNKDSLRARLQKGRWRMMRPLGHVHFWSRKSVELTFSQSGWRVRQRSRNDVWNVRDLAHLGGWPGLLAHLTGMGDQWFIRAQPSDQIKP